MKGRRETGGVRKRGNVWWLHYRVDGKRYYESAATGDERAARSLLTQRRREIRDGTWIAPEERQQREGLTAATYLARWIDRRRASGIRNVHDEEVWMTTHVIPTIGHLPLAGVKRRHVRQLVADLQAKVSPTTGRLYASRTVLHVYRTLVTAFQDAILDELITTTPCTLKTRKGELPKKRDADPKWRAAAVYTRDEAEVLLSATAIPDDRRALYALMLLGGLRFAEAAGRRWRDYDASAVPLGRLTVATQADGADKERATKTGEVRAVPVHGALAAILATWKLSFAQLFGRHPRPDDPIVPSRRRKGGELGFRSTHSGATYRRVVEDLELVKLRRVPSVRHAMRATFLSLLEVDGANMAIARRATHAAPSDVVGGYIRVQWADVCAEISKLRFQMRRGVVVPMRRASGAISGANLDDPEKTKTQGLDFTHVLGSSMVGATGFEPPAQNGNARNATHSPESGRAAAVAERPEKAAVRTSQTQTVTHAVTKAAEVLRRMLARTSSEEERYALQMALEVLADDGADRGEP